MGELLAASCARSIPVAFWQSGSVYGTAEAVRLVLSWLISACFGLFPLTEYYSFYQPYAIYAGTWQVALTASTQLLVFCVVPATVRCKGVEIIAGESGIQPPFFSGEHRCMALQNVRQHILLLVLAFPVVSQTLTRLSVNHWRNRCLH